MDQQLIVAGFHRSGTSFVTQVLHEAGLFVGDDLIGVDDSNPYGHFEDRVPFTIHKQVLADNRATWQVDHVRPFRIAPRRWSQMERYVVERRAHHRLWGFKDPRVCLFIGAWKHLLPDARVLVVFRDYHDAVWSLRRRHARQMFSGLGPEHLHRPMITDTDLGLRMWVAHNEALLAAAETYADDVLVLPLEAIQQGYPVVERLRTDFDLALAPLDTRSLFDPGATTRGSAPLPVASRRLAHRAERVLAALWAATDL